MRTEESYVDKKQMFQYLFFIFSIGFVNALYQIAIIKHLSIGSPFASITLIINIIVSLTLLSLGLGAYLKKYVSFNNTKYLAALNAFLVLLSFLFLLRFLPDLSLDSPFSIVYIIFILSAPMLVMGLLIADIYQIFLDKKYSIAKLVFYHSIGFALGQLIAYLFINFIGANSLFVIIFFIFAAWWLKKKIFVLLILIVSLFLYLWPLDNYLENFRNKEMLLWPNTEGTENVYSGWSPYVKIDIFAFDDCISGVYNYGQQWMTCKDRQKDFELRSQLYPQLDGDILLIGAGGGMGVSQFDDSDNVIAVELDPLVVKLMKGRFSEFNNNAYNNFDVRQADGREFLESNDKKFDYIIYEGTDYTFAVKNKNFVEVENYLYSQEGIDLALSSLKKNGVFILMHTFGEVPVAKTMDAIGDDYFVDLREYYTELPVPFGGLILTVSKDIFAFNDLRDFYDENASIFYPYSGQLPQVEKITDDKPFLYIENSRDISSFIYYTLFIFILTILLLVFLPLQNKKAKLYFFLLGPAIITAELFFISKLRSLFSDYIATFVIFSILFFSAYSLGNYYFEKIKKYIWWTPLFFIASLILSNFIPWGANVFVKFIFTALILVPSGIFMGVFFPLALKNVSAKDLPFVYMINSLGVALGFFLFYLISIFFGFSISFVFSFILYILVLWLVKKI